ncbi:crossover junction endodeoxyribonuclease RuvC [Nitrosomonas sp.]|uniref:crossover junction endodeoxyribonuclease RuvC n=1 Tax=Nitrosomonas sp. TaxID=42353 RepID=UPI0025D2802F|nr:crossover junction endodeoxyribonuclease RuvC [Nitrosomonas sp.]
MLSSAKGIRILGIDPGLRITGFGIIEKVRNHLTYIGSGCVVTGEASLPDRLKTILGGLSEIIQQHNPEQVAVEQVFVNINPKSTLLLGQARGAAISAAVLHELSVYEYTALQVKQAVVGNGHAHKEQVQEMVMRLLGLGERPRPDAADALACAICHAHTGSGLLALGTRSRSRRGRRL